MAKNNDELADGRNPGRKDKTMQRTGKLHFLRQPPPMPLPPGTMRIRMTVSTFLRGISGIEQKGDQIVMYCDGKEVQKLIRSTDEPLQMVITIRRRDPTT